MSARFSRISAICSSNVTMRGCGTKKRIRRQRATREEAATETDATTAGRNLQYGQRLRGRGQVHVARQLRQRLRKLLQRAARDKERRAFVGHCATRSGGQAAQQRQTETQRPPQPASPRARAHSLSVTKATNSLALLLCSAACNCWVAASALIRRADTGWTAAARAQRRRCAA